MSAGSRRSGPFLTNLAGVQGPADDVGDVGKVGGQPHGLIQGLYTAQNFLFLTPFTFSKNKTKTNSASKQG